MLLPHGTIIALVDGRTFDLYRNAGNEAELDLQPVAPPKINSSNHSDAGHRSSHGNHADRRVAEDTHAKVIVNWLNQEVLQHRIQDLVIAADPTSLGELRKHYHTKLSEVLRHELAKDLAGLPRREITQMLRQER